MLDQKHFETSDGGSGRGGLYIYSVYYTVVVILLKVILLFSLFLGKDSCHGGSSYWDNQRGEVGEDTLKHTHTKRPMVGTHFFVFIILKHKYTYTHARMVDPYRPFSNAFENEVII